jgi:broad specificity phosphatase PhoE
VTHVLRLCIAVLLAACTASQALADDGAWATLRDRIAVLIIRHAQTEPGIGDPPGFRLDDCGTQRNLSEAGRAQAAAIGRQLTDRGVKVSRVESSRWCRCIDTARLAFPGLEVRPVDALNSFFGERNAEPSQTDALRSRISQWRGPGVLVLVTHQVNISALTGRFVGPGEGLVLQPEAAGPRVAGAVQF